MLPGLRGVPAHPIKLKAPPREGFGVGAKVNSFFLLNLLRGMMLKNKRERLSYFQSLDGSFSVYQVDQIQVDV
jgi:hypothetical protein